MRPLITLITLGVEDLEQSLRFYRDGLCFPTQGIVGTEYEHGAVPRNSLAHEANIPLGPRSATEFMLGHNVASKAEVDAVMARARLAGAVITNPAHDAFWGGYTGSFQDQDGHLWEVAWNPDCELPD